MQYPNLNKKKKKNERKQRLLPPPTFDQNTCYKQHQI